MAREEFHADAAEAKDIAFGANCGGVYFTGSRAIAPKTCKAESDIDFVVLGSEQVREALLKAGFEEEGASQNYDIEGFRSLRKGRINMIVTPSEDFYNRFVLATRLAKRLRLAKKGDRLAVFQAILYGNAP